MDGNKSVASWFRERLSKITTSAQEQASAAGVSVNFDKSTTLQHSEHSLSAAAVSSSAIKPLTQRADFTTSVDRILKEFAPQEEARIAFVGETAGAQGHLIDGLLEGSLAYKDSEVYRKAVAEYLARPSVQKQSEENSLNLCLDNEFAKKVHDYDPNYMWRRWLSNVNSRVRTCNRFRINQCKGMDGLHTARYTGRLVGRNSA